MSTSLAHRVEEQFNKHNDLRVLFLFDPDEVHREDVDRWEHEGIECIVATPARFTLRDRIYTMKPDAGVFLYIPEPRPDRWENEPLLDLWMANRELHIDRVGEFMDAYNLPPSDRDVVQPYFKGELEYKNRRQFLTRVLKPERFSKRSLTLGLAAYHAQNTFSGVRFKTVPREEEVLAALMVGATDAEAFAKYKAVCDELELSDRLGMMLKQQFDVDTAEFSLEAVRRAAEVMKYNLLMRPVKRVSPTDRYRSFRVRSSLILNELESLKNAWEESGALDRGPVETLDLVASRIDEDHLTSEYGAETTFGYLTPGLRRRRIDTALAGVSSQPSASKEAVEPLLDAKGVIAEAAQFVWHLASMYQGLRDATSTAFSGVESFVQSYTETLYRVDTHYRKAISAYRSMEEAGHTPPEDLKEAMNRALKDYRQDFEQPVNTEWQVALEKAVSENAGDFSPRRIGSGSGAVLCQGAFYEEYLADDEHKTAVIVSDALRYEVARELSDHLLQQNKRTETELAPMLAALPTVTSLGMAHLLPHASIVLDGETPTINGESTGGTKNRASILAGAHPSSATAETYENLAGLDRDAGRDLFKDHRLVYIYHNRIDATADDRKTESETIPAIEKTVDELRQLIQTLNNWNVYRIVVVADHGFLYDHGFPSAGNDERHQLLESFPEAEGQVMRGNRSVLAKECTGDSARYRFPLRVLSDVEADLEICVPRAVNRYKLSGAGKRFVHGGASLQEMIVPALVVRKWRKDKAKKVTPRLLSKDRVINSGALNIQIVQTEPVSAERSTRTLTVALYADGERISDLKTVSLDATSEDPVERTTKVLLTLDAKANNLNFCHLRVFDTEDDLNPVIEQRYSIQRLFEKDF